jgi:hypothetical protein
MYQTPKLRRDGESDGVDNSLLYTLQRTMLEPMRTKQPTHGPVAIKMLQLLKEVQQALADAFIWTKSYALASLEPTKSAFVYRMPSIASES